MSLEKKLGVAFVGMLFVAFCCVLTMRLTSNDSDQKVDISFGAENSGAEAQLAQSTARPTHLAEQRPGGQTAFPAAQPRKFANSSPGDFPQPVTPPQSAHGTLAVARPPQGSGHTAMNAGAEAMPGNNSPDASSPYRAVPPAGLPNGDNRYAITASMADSRYATPARGSGPTPPISPSASSSEPGSSTLIDVAAAPSTNAPSPTQTAFARPTMTGAPTVAATTMTGDNPLRAPSAPADFAASRPAETAHSTALTHSGGFASPNITSSPPEVPMTRAPTSAAASRHPSSGAEQASGVASPSTSPSTLPGVASLTLPGVAVAATAPGLAPSVAAQPLAGSTAASPVATVSASIPVASSGKDQPYVVAPGDTLYAISQKIYGEGAYYRALFAYNSDRYPHAEDIRAGNVLDVPPLDYLKRRYPELTSGAADPAGQSFGSRASTSGGTYVVREGDTLFDIARRQLGQASRWTELYNLNRSALGENLENLRPGIELKLP